MNRTDIDRLRGALAQLSDSGVTGALRPEGLGNLAKELGLGSFSGDDIVGLWHMGLMRADLLRADRAIERPGLTLLKQEDDGCLLYLDSRIVQHRIEGHGGALQATGEVGDDIELWFHPFRLYVLSHVQRTLKVETTNTQYLVYPQGIETVAKRLKEEMDRWTSSEAFGDRFDYWNATAELAVVCEPFVQGMSASRTFSQVDRRAEFNAYLAMLRSLLTDMGKPEVRTRREDLGFSADSLDGNRNIQVLLRLMLRQHLEKVKGSLGGAMRFLSMAEIIRRAAEDAFSEHLAEEDEIGPGQWMAGARKMLYGSERVFDAERRDLRDYMALLGLDFGTKVRCYVEGDTEMGALSHATAGAGHVELINLAGQVIEKRRKGLAFVDGLTNDLNARVFSVILLDQDRSEFVKAVKKAAREKRFFGRYFLCDPDFEFGNFANRELVDVALSLTKVDELDASAREAMRMRLHADTATATVNSQLWSALDSEGIHDIGKSEQWGRALMKYAIEHPQRSSTGDRVGDDRPIIEAARLILRTRDAGFMRSIAELDVDAETGKLVPKLPSGGQ